MRTPEGDVKHRVKLLLEKFNILPFKNALAVIKKGEYIHGNYSMPAATGYGEAGIGDFLVCLSGHYIEIETKTTNGKLRGIQKVHGEVVAAAGGSYIVIREEEDMSKLEAMLDQSYQRYQRMVEAIEEMKVNRRGLH